MERHRPTPGWWLFHMGAVQKRILNTGPNQLMAQGTVAWLKISGMTLISSLLLAQMHPYAQGRNLEISDGQALEIHENQASAKPT